MNTSIVLYDFGGTVGTWEPACDIKTGNPEDTENDLTHCAVICGPRMVCSVSPMSRLDGEDMANAWLIAAAPDLLAAVQSYLRTGDTRGMVAAVKKATGSLS